MKREALIRQLRKYARKNGYAFDLQENRGAGSHYLIRLNGEMTTIQYGELDRTDVKTILKQLKIDPAAL